MATITSDTYLDGGTARTAGETWTCNGGILTIRTDTRWHANAPASMTGSIGSTTVSSTLGGGVYIDATNVRWLAYNSGSGNVPAIGTSITQAGVSSSYLLGIYGSLTSAPTAVGAAMPASGYIKFREVSGAFTSGALTGIGASATGADVAGWIEVVQDQAAANTIPRLGFFRTRGKWFYLDDTTGSAGQILQVPTNGGGVLTEVPGVWISEAPQNISNASWSAGVATFTVPGHGYGYKEQVLIQGVTPSGYNLDDEITIIDEDTFSMKCSSDPGSYSSGGTVASFLSYPALKTTTSFTTSDLGTDERSRFVQNMAGGQVRIGSDGTDNIGFVPPAGRKVRVPNIFLRQCATASRAANATPHATIATRPDFVTTNAGVIDVEFVLADWYFLLAQPYSVKLKNFANFDSVNISECATALDLNNGISGMSGGLDLNSLLLTSNFAGGEIVEWGGPRGNAAGSNDHDISLQYCIGQTFYRTRGGILRFARLTGVPIYANQCSNLTFIDCRTSNGPLTLNTSFNCVVKNEDHVDRYVGATNTSAGYAIVISNSCDGIVIDGVTFGLNGTISNCHPYSGIVYCAASSNIKIRNFGTRSAFLNGGSANQCAYAFLDGGNNVNVSCQRIYMTPTRTGIYSSVNSSKNLLFEDCYGDYGDAITSAGLNMLVRGGGGTNSTTGQASVYGTHFGGAFTSDTVGRIWLALNEPTAETQQYTESSFSAGSGFTSDGGLSLATAGDYYICEMQVFKKQHTGFQNAAPTLTGTNTGNHDFEYQIDTGSGWNGTWKTLNGTNLSGETISPSAGFKLKFKITCNTSNTANLISYVRILTDSTLEAQLNNLYPLDTSTLTLTGLQNNTEIRVFEAGTTNEIAGQESVTSGTFTTQIDAESYPLIDISIMNLNYQNTRLLGQDITQDLTIPIQQITDRQYVNP